MKIKRPSKSVTAWFGSFVLLGVFYLLLPGYTCILYKPTPRRSSEATMQMVEASLGRYFDFYGAYPEPAKPNEPIEIESGVLLHVGGAKCLYQALTGDGNDAIKGVSGEAATSSNGTLENEERKRIMFKDMPSSMRSKVGNSYIIVDGYGRPFQYIKADPEKKDTINSTYDLWSYGDDDTNLRATSKDTEANPALGAKWIKNW